MKKILITLAFSLLCATPAFAADPDPCVLNNTTSGPSHGGFPGTVVSADFDGDGFEDRACARLAQLDAEGPVYIDVEFGPFDEHGYPTGGVTTVERYQHATDFGGKTLSIVRPGVYQSLCAKGYGDACGHGNEVAVYTSHPSIATGTEGASWMYVYTGRNPVDPNQRLFRTYWLSD